jgi:hypothetical protein
VAFATLCLVGIAGVLVALISASMPPGARSSPLADTARYLHSGQTAADLRTMTAIVEYLLDKEPSLATNLVQLRGNERQFAQPTNVNALKPKV